jgi:hypothetical protein
MAKIDLISLQACCELKRVNLLMQSRGAWMTGEMAWELSKLLKKRYRI